MPINIRTRELFPSYAKGSDVPRNRWDSELPNKSWRDEFLYKNPSFVGKKEILSPSGMKVIVNYTSKYVVYPYGFFHIDGKPVIDEFIVSRLEAVTVNLPLGDEGTAYIGPRPLDFDGFPMDRPLGMDEILGRHTPFAAEEILTRADLQTSVPTMEVLGQKLDHIITLLEIKK